MQDLITKIQSKSKQLPNVVDFYHEYLIDRITGSPLMPESKNNRLSVFWEDILTYVVEEPRWYLILLPRYHYKTSLITVGIPIYRICEDENYTGGIIQANQDNTNQQLGRIKMILESHEKLINDFGPFEPPRRKERMWRANSFRIIRSDKNKTLPTLFGNGANSRITGKHCDQLILDDIEDNLSVLTDANRQRTVGWFRETVIPILNKTASNGNPGQMIVVGTRKHPSDIYSRMLSGEIKGQDLVKNRITSTVKQGEDLLEQAGKAIDKMEIINV